MENSNQAGVLFYKKINSNIYFLLGKNKHTLKYSHFSEQKNENDSNIIDTVSRSFPSQTMEFIYNKKQLEELLPDSTTYYNSKNKNSLFVVKSNINDEQIKIFNNISNFINNNSLETYSGSKIELKWFRLDEILSYIDYFDKKFIRTLCRFLKENNL